MTASLRTLLLATVALGSMAVPSGAQDDGKESFPFAGGLITIEETADYDKILAFDGEELARDYFVMFDRIAQVGGVEVAFVMVGPGGNACAPGVVMIWKPEGGDVTSATTGEDCGSPPPAVADNDVYFVPYLLPGDITDIQAWNPDEGFRIHGRLAYAPQPDTSWETFDPSAIGHPLDLFRNAGIYAAAQALLGDALSEVATGLGTAGEPELVQSGLLSARGCVPHACGLSDTVVVVDPASKALYFAQQGDPVTRYWPTRETWPQPVAALLPSDF